MENIQPFSAKDLSIRSLGDRIRDLGQLRNLYPNIPKDQAFGSHYNSEWWGRGCYVHLPSDAAARNRAVWRGEGPGQVLLGKGVVAAPCWGVLMGASPLRAEEQTGKDGRGYVSTAIKMTVESERWVRARLWPCWRCVHRPPPGRHIAAGWGDF